MGRVGGAARLAPRVNQVISLTRRPSVVADGCAEGGVSAHTNLNRAANHVDQRNEQQHGRDADEDEG